MLAVATHGLLLQQQQQQPQQPLPPQAPALAFREIGNGFHHKNPAVCAFSGRAGGGVNNTFPGSNSTALFTTSFDALGPDEVTVVRDFGAAIRGAGPFTDEVVETDTLWPNMATVLPASEFGAPALLLAGGFLVPGKTPGSVDVLLFNATTGAAAPAAEFRLSTDRKGYFYHDAQLHDMDGDGDRDVVAARATDPTVPWEKKHAQLLWLERPDEDPTAGGWKEHLLFEDGPDVSFVFDDFDGDGKLELLATEFFVNQRLALYSCSEAHFGACGPDAASQLQVTVIDGTNGPFFSAQRADLNADGRDDLLVTNNRDDGKGAVFAYELPEGPGQLANASAWAAPRVLASGYKPPASLAPGKGAPGNAVAFQPQVPSPSEAKPYILLSGDDGGVADLLVPAQRFNASDWAYERTRVANVSDEKAGGTVGTVTAADTDGDGYVEFVVPLYTDSLVRVFTFAPGP